MYRPDLAAESDDRMQAVMDQGTEVGAEARKAFPGGVLAEADYQHTRVALEETARLMANPDGYLRYMRLRWEYDGVLVRVGMFSGASAAKPLATGGGQVVHPGEGPLPL